MNKKTVWYLACLSVLVLFVSCDTKMSTPKTFLQEICNELNYARTNPSGYAQAVLEPRLSRFDGEKYQQDNGIYLITNEGKTPVEEAITELKTLEPCSALTLDSALCKVSDLLAQYQASTGKTGHDGPNDMTLGDRLKKYGSPQGSAGENCAYGPKTPREIVAQLIIDDGVPSRGHRENIFNANFKLVGISYIEGASAAYGSVCVMDFATAYTAK